jgi:hypothetical protein
MEGLGQPMRGAIREDTEMPEHKKSSLASDHSNPIAKGKRKREGEEAKAATLNAQGVIQRTGDDDPKVGKPAERAKGKREGEEPAPPPLTITTPIQRPDPNPDPIVPPKPGSERGEGR